MFIKTKMLKHNHHEYILVIYSNELKCSIPKYFTLFQQNGAISVPDTVEDDGQGSEGTPSDDLESAVPSDSDKGVVKFGWIRGVLVSYVGS